MNLLINLEATFNFQELKLVIFNGLMMEESYLPSSYLDISEKVTSEMWEKLSEIQKIELIQSFIDNKLTAASGGCLTASKILFHSESK